MVKLIGREYSIIFEAVKEKGTSWSGGGHYEEKTATEYFFYRGVACLIKGSEKYLFKFETSRRNASVEENLFFLPKDVKIPKEKESRLVDIVVSKLMEKIEFNGGEGNYIIYIGREEIKRKELEEKNIVPEKDGQRRIEFD